MRFFKRILSVFTFKKKKKKKKNDSSIYPMF
ncbi:hypothetical protein L585_04210 [Pantoea ananatis BRT175]|nr:hypothetical protein L585_04210 [Pantoea ananatis BRT175]